MLVVKLILRCLLCSQDPQDLAGMSISAISVLTRIKEPSTASPTRTTSSQPWDSLHSQFSWSKTAETDHAAPSSGAAAGVLNCPYCPRQFVFNSLFERHMRSHTNERPFQCNLCSYRAKHRANLKSHYVFKHPGVPFE